MVEFVASKGRGIWVGIYHNQGQFLTQSFLVLLDYRIHLATDLERPTEFPMESHP